MSSLVLIAILLVVEQPFERNHVIGGCGQRCGVSFAAASRRGRLVRFEQQARLLRRALRRARRACREGEEEFARLLALLVIGRGVQDRGFGLVGEVRAAVLLAGDARELRIDGDVHRRHAVVGFDEPQFGEQLVDVILDLSDALTVAGHVRGEQNEGVGHLEESRSVRLHIDRV